MAECSVKASPALEGAPPDQSPRRPGPSRDVRTWRRLATSRTKSIALPRTSAPFPLLQSRSVATKYRCLGGVAWKTIRAVRQYASKTGAASAGGASTSRPRGRNAVRTMYENIAQGHPPWCPILLQVSLGSGTEPVSQLGDGYVTETLGRLAHGPIGSHSSSKEVAHQRHVGGFRVSHKVSQHVTDAPTRTP